MTEDEFRAHVAALVEQTCGSTAALARKHKLHPKALTLFLSGARGPSAEVARAFGFERQYVSRATPSQRLDAATVERLRDAATAWTAFVTARTRMNGAIPALDASAAERALYDERYKADHEAEREHYRTACQLAQVAGKILAALATEPHQHGGKGA